jgi:hypothetical protein
MPWSVCVCWGVCVCVWLGGWGRCCVCVCVCVGVLVLVGCWVGVIGMGAIQVGGDRRTSAQTQQYRVSISTVVTLFIHFPSPPLAAPPPPPHHIHT